MHNFQKALDCGACLRPGSAYLSEPKPRAAPHRKGKRKHCAHTLRPNPPPAIRSAQVRAPQERPSARRTLIDAQARRAGPCSLHGATQQPLPHRAFASRRAQRTVPNGAESRPLIVRHVSLRTRIAGQHAEQPPNAWQARVRCMRQDRGQMQAPHRQAHPIRHRRTPGCRRFRAGDRAPQPCRIEMRPKTRQVGTLSSRQQRRNAQLPTHTRGGPCPSRPCRHGDITPDTSNLDARRQQRRQHGFRRSRAGDHAPRPCRHRRSSAEHTRAHWQTRDQQRRQQGCRRISAGGPAPRPCRVKRQCTGRAHSPTR